MIDQLTNAATNSIDTVGSMIGGFFTLLPKIFIALIVFALVFVAARIIKDLVSRIVGARAAKSVGVALGRIAHVATIFVGLLISVAIVAPSVGAAELIQVLGVGSVAIGFAFRDILQNFLAGLIILLRRPFTEGDWIEFDGYEGVIKEISTRSTWIHTFDGRDVSIPNGEIFTNPITIMTRDPKIRTDYEFGISYEADITKAKKVIIDAIKSVEGVSDFKNPDVGVSDLAASSVNLKARWWSSTDDVYSVKLNVLEAVKNALDDAEIEIPFPHRQLMLPENANLNVAANDLTKQKGI
ncbi:mechanosensitive ion channel family protein [Maritalea porphyrae]|uniref:Small-conductance mechanosensitive channel n=1 Tax=Maritalea porphyrae TaxID=880732 RepID=A0ABQ5UPR9_9HYPH|nr:mechanosensitive ion channel family protein [Maritalea porphyrae]GLQ15952.1 transporter [Maritalea porphyrae]